MSDTASHVGIRVSPVRDLGKHWKKSEHSTWRRAKSCRHARLRYSPPLSVTEGRGGPDDVGVGPAVQGYGSEVPSAFFRSENYTRTNLREVCLQSVAKIY